MELIRGAFPGFALAVCFFFLILMAGQVHVYRYTKFKRAKNLAWFCFITALTGLEHFIVQSRIFEPELTRIYVTLIQFAYPLSLYFYLNSISFYVAISDRSWKVFTRCSLALSGVFLASGVYGLTTGWSGWFDPNQLIDTGNNFVNSYSLRFGMPGKGGTTFLGIYGVLSICVYLYVLRRVLAGARDSFFIVGLVFGILAVLYENTLLPFTFAYFFPVVFVSNLFEAFRMSFLSMKEYFVEEEQGRKEMEALEKRYQNTNLNEARIDELSQSILTLRETEPFYLNPNLRLEDLAKKMKIPSYQLTQVIQIGLGTGFYDFVNSSRIEHVKKQLLDPESKGRSIIDLAYESGFNSKSTFNTAFKKHTGMTPSEYRKDKC